MMPPPSPGAPPSQVLAEEEEVRPPLQSKAAGLPGPMLVGGTGRGGNSRLPAGSQSESTWAGTGAGVRTPRRGSAQPCQHWDPEAGDRVQPPCSQGLSCHLWDGDVICLPGSIVSAPGPVLVPTCLQTELVLRCYQETDCDLCVRVAVHLAVHGHGEEPEDEEKLGRTADPELEEPRNGEENLASPTAPHQAYSTARCVLLEVQVPATLVQPGQSVGSVVFDCFEAALGSEVRIWSYTQPRYQKELNLTQQLPDCRRLEVRDSIQSCRVLPWLNVSANGDDVRLVLDVSEEQQFGLSLYWNQVPGPSKSLWHRNLTGPQTITLNHTDLVPCLCIQVWPLKPDSTRTSTCPFSEDPRAYQNLWLVAQLQLLPPRGWRLDAPCSVPATATLCWQAPDRGPCQPLVPPLLQENVTVNKVLEFPLLKGHPNLCVQVSNWENVQLQECLWADSLGPLKNDMLLVETRGPHNNKLLCALEPSGCTPLPSKGSTRAARLGEQLLRDMQLGQCVQLWDEDLGALWACPMDKYIHKRWALVWLACLLFAAVLFLLFLLKKDHVKGWLRLLKDIHAGAESAARSRTALLLYSADDASFERLVGALASALCQLPLRVAVDLWSRRELSALGPLAWFHAQRRQTLQEGGTVVLLFSPGAVALCCEWMQDRTSAPGARGPHDAFAASLSCVLPDFLQGRAPGRYVGAYFDTLLHPDAVPALFRTVPVFSLPSQLPDLIGTLQGPGAPRSGRLAERAEQVSRALQPALDSCFRPPAGPGDSRDGTWVGT
ncbi:interleukin-17 receptor C isoform X8 [Manis pentadactyla]|uniref:interleukin-17 receptor C isoform X8 n=1 Tax=Manis pentadactyla TaxID=143292 RepID=UPI00255CA367|nr:interleukin-17 receptor C isoform X8 [Manis pentadactyla]